jgi:hypothetical protein
MSNFFPKMRKKNRLILVPKPLLLSQFMHIVYNDCLA